MKQIGMYGLAPMETVRRLGEQAQAAHGFDTISGDAPSPEGFASGVCAQHPKYFQGLRRKTTGQETPSPDYSPTQKTDRGRCFGGQDDAQNSRITRASSSYNKRIRLSWHCSNRSHGHNRAQCVLAASAGLQQALGT
jgi:hypothetical protein